MGARANLAHMLLQACLKLIGNCHAECKIYQHHKAIIIKTCVPNSRPKLSPSSSKQAKNERERPKLLQLGPEAVLSVNLFFLRNLSMTGRSTCKTQWKRSVGGLRKNTKTNWIRGPTGTLLDLFEKQWFATFPPCWNRSGIGSGALQDKWVLKPVWLNCCLRFGWNWLEIRTLLPNASKSSDHNKHICYDSYPKALQNLFLPVPNKLEIKRTS